MKDFYLSVQPQYTRKKEQVITPTRPPRQTSQSGTSSRSIATPVKTKVPKTATKWVENGESSSRLSIYLAQRKQKSAICLYLHSYMESFCRVAYFKPWFVSFFLTIIVIQTPPCSDRSLPMPAEAAGSMREERIKELHQIQKQRIQNTIRANEKKLLDDIVAGQ